MLYYSKGMQKNSSRDTFLVWTGCVISQEKLLPARGGGPSPSATQVPAPGIPSPIDLHGFKKTRGGSAWFVGFFLSPWA